MSLIKYILICYKSYLWLIMAVYLISCSHQPITVNYFPEKVITTPDSLTTIKWSFENADRVKVRGIDRYFYSSDSLLARIFEPRKYNVTAYQGNVDSLVKTCLVTFSNDASTVDYSEPGEKPAIKNNTKEVTKKNTQIVTISPSYSPSEYFIGMTDAASDVMPVKFKVMRTINSPDDKEFTARFVLLDKNGNHIYGLPEKLEEEFVLSAENVCGNEYKIFYDRIPAKEVYNPREPENVDIGILLDNSAVAQSNQLILFYLKEFASRLYQGDKISFSFFNQSFGNEISLSPYEDAVSKISAISIPDNTGSLNGLYRATLNAVNTLKSGMNKTKALVILTYYDDNCSVSFDINDCANYARENGIPVYVIAIGNAVRSYYLKYLTDMTGGKLYFQFDDELGYISDILTEISLSLRYYYEFKVSKNTSSHECLELVTNVKAKAGEYELQDELNTVLKPYSKYSFPQSICTFDKNSITISQEFHPIFESLASILKDNSNSEIQLIGHTSDEGTVGFGKDLSLRRAEEARKLLVSKGVDPSQIKLRSEGSAKPNFTFIKSSWQEYYNRRVEIRWLDPSILPYEIEVQSAESETQAYELLSLWEKRGQKAYFERYMQGDLPYYKVKLWGYATIEAARQAAKSLSAKYRANLTVE